VKYYISGPMSGIPDYNYPYFEKVTKQLRARGFNILSPHENPQPTTSLTTEGLWQYFMNLCEKQVEEADVIIMLPGWMYSRGAMQELQWAIEQRMPVHFYATFLEFPIPMGGPNVPTRLV
jgi:nucleoside 2-deoxyribosyltransferase